VLREAEAAHIKLALEATGGHRTQTAELLGISRKVLWEKLKELDLEDAAGDGSEGESNTGASAPGESGR
jgi:DNA-binding NtrC family response regulator